MGPTRHSALLDHLAAAPGEFDFVQAVDILEQAARARKQTVALLGRGSDPAREAVAVRTPFEFGFRPMPIEEARFGASGPARLSVNVLALAGSDGPLPEPYVDLIRANLLEREEGPAEFLGLFQHRLLSYGYRAVHELRCAPPFAEPGQGPLAPALRALAGGEGGDNCGADGGDADDGGIAALLAANLSQAANMRRSLHGLCLLLGRCFGVTVTGREATGAWLALPPELRTVLGPAGRNRRLRAGAVLGKRSFRPDGALDLDFGTLPAPLYRALLPAGAHRAALASLCAWYLGPDILCRVRLACVPERPRCLLDRACRLGQASWAGAAPAQLACVFELDADAGCA